MKQSILALSAAVAFSAAAATGTSSGVICGAKGYDKMQGGFQGKQATFDGCLVECKKDSNCKSFSIGNKECNLYSVAVSGNLESVSDSPYAFFDVSCTSLSLSSSTTSTSTSTKSTSAFKTSTTSAKLSTTTSSKITTSTKTTSKSTTTLSKTSTKVTTTSSTASSTTATPPCPLPTFVVTNFMWFNSTHNADCAANAPDVGDGTGCLGPNSENAWCDPRTVANCTSCGINVCYTGLPTQPIGYGPPDYISADISNIGSCRQSNPGTTPRREVGNDIVRCGGSQIQFTFHGDSNKAKSVASLDMQNMISCGDGSGYYASGSGQAAMTCTYDSGRNATCTLDNPAFGVPATSWGNAWYPNSDN